MPNRIRYHNPNPGAIRYAPTPRDAERDAFYNSTRWKKLRKAYLDRSPENRLCARCRAEGRTALAEIVHHVKERLLFPELAFSMDNLEGLCKGCHNRVHKAGRLKSRASR